MTETSAPPPTVGIVFRPQSPPEDLPSVAREAEAAGIAELWLWEDCFLEGGLTSATAALLSSERLKVGIGLLPVPLRNPALAAMELATIERLAPGRLVAGFGHGVLDWMGQVGARVASPLTLLREYVTAVRSLLDGDTADADGRYVKLDRVALGWPPASAPEIAIGATRPQTLRLAGELGDSVLLDSVNDAAAVRAARVIVDEGRAESGRPGRTRVRVFAEVDPRSDAPASRIADRIAELVDAGADAVAVQAPADAPDPRPLLDALPR
ncbi:LLM class flavin-dependent oxidoreductase [Microbacterium betulae]|uniref:LLM class flavin-dependent oxidoreductase n=1 Tax=Microbacterium betulae TaxID=2981139 RepID=A0AA97FHY3_9MICO|nr:LLM class flavin-dependent oxidoreductase [Microbacterium sp. AB]WOF23365.1 LLM class flavin-dependent oxidoreductase [Microbacterium sp. AB]